MSRQDRVAEAIRKEVSLILHDELKDPRLGFVTITRAEVSGDLRNAKVFFSVLGNDEAVKNTQAALDSALGFIRKLVSERINLRYAPEIVFRNDKSTEYSVRIEEILNEIRGSNPPEPPQPAPKPRKAGQLERKKNIRRNKKT